MDMTLLLQMLNFLLQNGFTRMDILYLPRVLTLSMATCAGRLDKLKELNYKSIHKKFWIFALDHKNFDLFLDRIKWRKANSKENDVASIDDVDKQAIQSIKEHVNESTSEIH